MKYLLLIAGTCFLSFHSMAQSISPEVISTSGTSFNNASGQLDWTLGETATATLNGTGNDLTQGFHQPEILITGLDETASSSTVSVFPNPTISSVQIQFSDLKDNTVIELYTMDGKLLQSQKADQPAAQINMETYTAGIYLLKITDNTNKTNTYKISKSH